MMSLDTAVLSMLEDWYDEFLAEGLSEEQAAKKVQEKFEDYEATVTIDIK
jgi:hypothetical protein|tara:strand:+ start:843 stop:992 length:150 start_codon:yes stop_codon:yes gene_type:complete